MFKVFVTLGLSSVVDTFQQRMNLMLSGLLEFVRYMDDITTVSTSADKNCSHLEEIINPHNQINEFPMRLEIRSCIQSYWFLPANEKVYVSTVWVS